MNPSDYYSKSMSDLVSALLTKEDPDKRSHYHWTEIVNQAPWPTAYEVVRYRVDQPPEVLDSYLTLEQARDWCNRDDSHGDGWFDGYREM